MIKLICAIQAIVVLALMSLLVIDDRKVCFDYGKLKTKAVESISETETVPVE